jgi:TonB family protein
MKNVQKLILVTGALVSQWAFGTETLEQAYVASYKGRTDMPVPISVVKPDIPPLHGGLTVTVAFVVDESGTPRGVKVVDPDAVDRALAREVVGAVEQWRFQPLLRDGRAVAVRVHLPFRIVDDLDARGMVVAK